MSAIGGKADIPATVQPMLISEYADRVLTLENFRTGPFLTTG